MAHIVIIGSSIAGQSAAFNIREQDRSVAITLISDEDQPLYDRRLLPDYLAGRIREEELFLCSPDFYSRRDIVFLPECRVSGLEPEKKAVSLRKGSSLKYDALIIASGLRPPAPEIPGARKPGVEILWSLEDARRLRNRIVTEPVCIVAAERASFQIAAALAEKFRQEVKLISLCQPQADALSEAVEVIPSSLKEIIGEGQVQAVRISEGKVIGVGSVIFMEAAGSIDFLKGSGISLEGSRIIVDEHGSTNIPGIYACGGVACCCGEQAGCEKSWEQCAQEGRLLASHIVNEMERACQNS